MRHKLWDLAFIFFCICLLLFGFTRAKHDLRWSAWAGGETETLNGAMHFAQDGFLEHYFMHYPTPGYLGKISETPNSVRVHNPIGYNIRYPTFGVIFDGILIRLLNADRTCLKSVAVIFAVFAVIFSYLVFQFFVSKPVAFFASFFIGSSVGFLQLMDSPTLYIYSECFRFAILFFFLLSEKIRGSPWKFYFVSGILWLFLFVEAFNSFDYYIFLQLFFWLYYWLSRKKLPFGRVFFLASAPLLSFALHKTLAHLLLQQYNVSSAPVLLRDFFEKTLPFQKGFLGTALSIPYFLRALEKHMVQSNYGFGFDNVILMCAVVLILYLHYKEELQCFFQNPNEWPLSKMLLLFFLPSISWWVIFPNHTVSLLYTPIHAVAAIGLVFSLCLIFSLKILKDKAQSIGHKITFSVAVVGCLWSPLLTSSKYLKEYPNLLDTTERDYIGLPAGLGLETLSEFVLSSKKLGESTSYGDIIIMLPEVPIPSSGILEYYSQRRADSVYEDSETELKQKIEKLKKYRQEGAKIYKRFDPNLKIYILADKDGISQTHRYCEKMYKPSKLILNNWVLYRVNNL